MPRALFGIRYSARKFARTPGLTLALLLTIALGIGSNISVYGFIRGFTRAASPLTSGMSPETVQGMLRIANLLRFAAGAIFLVACVNVVLFLLGRAFTRSQETSLRVALGAGRTQLLGELLWDSMVISVAGGALGVLLAIWTAHIIPALLFAEDAEHLVFASDVFTIIAASTVCIGITITCGMVPIFEIRADRPAAILQRENGGPSRAIGRLSVGLVVAQMASCCTLVVCTAFLLSGFRAALQTAAGHRIGNPILVTVEAQPQPEVDLGYFQRVEQAVQSTRGLSPKAWTGRVPGSQSVWQSFRIDPRNLPLRDVSMDIDWFGADSLKLFTLPPIGGRLFGFPDQKCRVAIVDKEAAAELFGRNTIGRIIQDSTGQSVEIIGVLARKARNPAKVTRPTIYYNSADNSGSATPNPRSRFRVPILSELKRIDLEVNVISPSYFNAMAVSLVAGQEFTEYKVPGECRVGVINREAADLYFAGAPIGAAIIDDQGTRTTIIGVIHSRPFGTFQRRVEPAIYFPMWQDCLRRMTLVAGIRNVNGPMLADLHRKIEAVPGRSTGPVVLETLSTHLVHTALAPLRITMAIIGASATTALVLSVLGLFSALAQAARQRRRELAIRIALGAQRWAVASHLLIEGVRFAAAGTLIGTLGSLALSRWLVEIAPGNGSPPFWIWVAAPIVLVLAVAIASVLPARRASIVNPASVMRDGN